MPHNFRSERLSSFAGIDSARCFSLIGDHGFTLGELFFQAQQVAKRLPEARHAINLCQDRYLFSVAFLAVVLRGQINLLPQNRSSGCVENLLKDHRDSYCIRDERDSGDTGVFITSADLACGKLENLPDIPDDQIAAISFTSGSTGDPKTVVKSFGEFLRCARLATQRLGIGPELSLLSTVPPQHTYGLETSLFWPLVSGASILSSRPFFPEDIRATLAATKQTCFLISTPTQLKACIESNLAWTNLAGVLSSTAAMPLKLANAIEKSFGVSLFEVFGSTETLSFATRRLCVAEAWQPYEGVEVCCDPLGFQVFGGHLHSPLRLDDRIVIDHKGHFTLAGRSSDLVKIGGKRASLAELNRLINEIEGIRDAVFYLTSHGRLGALVVGEVPRETILAVLRNSIDEVFLPRPLHFVAKIPRNELGKIAKWKLNELIGEFNIG